MHASAVAGGSITVTRSGREDRGSDGTNGSGAAGSGSETRNIAP